MAIDLVARFRLDDRFTRPMRSMTEQLRRFERSASSSTRNANQFRDANGRLRDSMGRYVSEGNRANNMMSRFSTRMTGIRASSSGLSASFSGMQSALVGLAGAYLGVNAAAKAFDATIGAAARYQQAEVAVKAIFNDDAKSSAYLSMVDKMAIDSPLLNSGDMLKSSKPLVAMTKDVGELGKAWSIIERLMVLDPTQGTDGAAFALKEMWQGDAISMVERFGLNKGELNDIKKMSIPQQISEISKMLDGMGITQKTVDAMGSTTLGYWAQIGERVSKFMRQIGSMGNSKIGASLEKIVNTLDKTDLDSFAAKIDGVIGGMVDKAINFTKLLWKWREPVTYVLGALATFAGALAIVGTISMLLNPISLIAMGISAAALGFKALYDNSEKFRGVINGIGSAFKAVTKIFDGEHKAAIDILEAAGLNPGQVELVRKFGYALKSAFGKIDGVFKSISSIFGGEHKAAIDILKRTGFSPEQADAIRKFGYSLKSAFDKVSDILGGVGTMLTGGGTADLVSALGISPETVSKITSIFGKVKSAVGTVVTWLKTKFNEVKPSLVDLGTKFMSFKDTLVNAFTTLFNNAQPILSGIWSALQVLGDIASTVFNNVIVPVLSFAMDAFTLLWDIVGPILSVLAGAFGATFGVLKIVWDTVLSPFVEWVTGIFKSALEMLGEKMAEISAKFEAAGGMWSFVWDGIVLSAETAVNYVIDLINGLIEAINNIPFIEIDAVANVEWSGSAVQGPMPLQGPPPPPKKRPGHYHGLDNVPYNGYAANLHKGEKVLTRQEAEAYRGGQGGGGNGGISIAKLADQIIVREDADIDRITDGIVTKILERRGVTV